MFKDFNQASDVTTQLGVVNEIIPLTGAFFTGSFYTKTYLNITSGSTLSGGFFETVYDGAPTSISASALVDITYGVSSASLTLNDPTAMLRNEKARVYKQMARMLLGSENTLFNFNNKSYHELFFLCFKRRIFKDEVKKGTVVVSLQVSGGVNNTLDLTDYDAAGNYKTAPGGDVGNLYSGSTVIGSVNYNLGIVAFPTGVFLSPVAPNSIYWSGSVNLNQSAPLNIDQTVDGLRNRINNIAFQNQTNLHSSIYFCRALNQEFNYSTNPSFVDSSGRIIPTSGSNNQTRTYITSVGLYDVNDNLLGVAKLSQPVKKSPDNELTVRVKISY